MITHVRIQNFRSFVDAEVDLEPFSLVVGANGSGKSNLLRFLSISSSGWKFRKNRESFFWDRHQNHELDEFGCVISLKSGEVYTGIADRFLLRFVECEWAEEKLSTSIFNLNPDAISQSELTIPVAEVRADGKGTCQVLDSLKNGDREDLFEETESNFRRYVPEVEKLSLRTVAEGKKQIQVRERGLKEPVPATELSEGTRLILCILTILHQENPPPVILLEDIDRGMHPRLFEQIAPLIRDIAERNQINIIATTQNPYLVDCFRDHEGAVIIVEKTDGASTLTTLAERMKTLDYDKEDPESIPLGTLWYSGLVGGVPKKSRA
jgi:predicted ATPase